MGDDDHGGLAVGEVPQDAEDFAGQLRVEGAGGLIEAEDVRVERQCAGDGHPLLLTAGKLVGVVACPLRQAHLGQQVTGLCFQLDVDGLFVGLVVGLLLCQKLPRQYHVFQRGVLGEEVEVLEHEAEVEALFPHLALPLGGRVGGVPHGLAVHPDDTGVGTLKEVQAAQQRRLARAGRADDRQRLALFQCERDVLENFRLAEILPDARGFE